MSTLPLPQQQNYQISKERAVAALSAYEAGEIAARSGGTVDGSRVLIPFFRWQAVYDTAAHELTLPQGVAGNQADNLVLHYLAYSKGLAPTGTLITFHQIRDALPYLPVFAKRTSGILLKAVRTADDFAAKSGRIGGERLQLTESGVTFRFHAFPKVPLTVTFYEGDDEFPSEAVYLFDETINSNLPPEDAIVSCQHLSLQYFKA